MMKKILVSSALFCGLLTLASCKTEEKNPEEKLYSHYAINFVPAKTNSELLVLTKDEKANMIRSVKSLDELIKKRISPLSKLPTPTIELIKENIVFNNGGLAGINYGILKDNLTREEFDEVMAMFGLDTIKGFWGKASSNARTSMDGEGTGEDYVDYQCIKPKTCKPETRWVCTRNC